MSIFTVSAKKEQELLDRMKQFNVSEKDIEESFVRSSGPGGQKVNKTASCVLIHHIPTGIRVKCQKERTQALNRFFARRILIDQIERNAKGFTSEEEKKIAKIRSRKRKRTKSGRAKMIESKNKKPEKE